MTSPISDKTRHEHRATWWVYIGTERIRYQKTMRGTWAYDVTCSCGWDSRTGGGTRRYVAGKLEDHRWDEQSEDRNETGRQERAEDLAGFEVDGKWAAWLAGGPFPAKDSE